MSFTLGDWSNAVVAAAPGFGHAKRALESELLSIAVFEVIHSFGLLPEDAVFVGGTALRLCHGSPRFSEDLDFHTPRFAPSMEQTPKGALRPWRLFHGQVGVAGPEAESAHSECEAPTRLWGARALDRATLAVGAKKITGCEISVSTPTGGGSTLARVSAEVPGRDRSQRRPRMKIDLGEGVQADARLEIITLKMAGGLVPGMGDVGDAFAFKTSSTIEVARARTGPKDRRGRGQRSL